LERSKDEQHSSAEFTKEQATIRSGVRYSAPILPYSTHQLDRTIVLEDHSRVEGDIYGKKVEIGVECDISGHVFAQEWLTVGLRSRVRGDILSCGSVVLEDGTSVGRENFGHVIAAEFRSGRNCAISGNVITVRSLEIGDDCSIKGMVCCIGGPVKMGMRTNVRDALSAGPLNIGTGAKIMDDVIWSRASIEADGIVLDGDRPEDGHKRSWQGAEINLNADRMLPGEKRPSKVDEEHIKAVREILGHRRA
jgi:UDP-3-O-[3-hydroxymyristoyl] glucosamine N-acyltransferase